MYNDTKLKSPYKVRKVNEYRLAAIYDYAGKSIIDIGCGSGAYIFDLKNKYDIQGIDINHFAEWDKYPALFNVGNAYDLSLFSDNSFDTATCFEVLEHLENPEKAVKELHRICRNNIIISVPNCEITRGMEKSSLIYYHWIDPTHIQFFDRTSICQLLEKCGFKIREFRYINPINKDLKHFMAEAFNLRGWKKNLLWYLFKNRLNINKFYSTCLVIAEK